MTPMFQTLKGECRIEVGNLALSLPDNVDDQLAFVPLRLLVRWQCGYAPSLNLAGSQLGTDKQKSGKGCDRAVSALPRKRQTATTPNKTPATTPPTRIHNAAILGALNKNSEAAHRAAPAPKTEPLAARSIDAVAKIST